jgi:zinc D-Ala-D-Ala dipeptidase
MLKKYTLPVIMILATACGQPPTPPKEEVSESQTDTLMASPADTMVSSQDTLALMEDDTALSDKQKGTTKSALPTDRPLHTEGVIAPNGGKRDVNFKVVTDLDPTIKLDIRYATANNFTKAKIYDCPACLLRPDAAAALVKAHQSLKAKGYGGLKMFDCYRPRPYQQRLWNIVPNPDYVTPPAKGSMHSRGAAVDLTIVDKNGKELDMGTPYDFFGREAHFDYQRLSPVVLANRRMLRATMAAAGFEGIRTEWWHFSYRKGGYPLSDYLWNCE